MIIPELWPQQLIARWSLKTVIGCVSVHSPSQDITNNIFQLKTNKKEKKKLYVLWKLGENLSEQTG